ncbi:MAG: hypothetical protein JSS72_07410 [Armatimonadetes bacterium]|nr:hypothetical protein [Armatimonadota bacterium]
MLVELLAFFACFPISIFLQFRLAPFFRDWSRGERASVGCAVSAATMILFALTSHFFLDSTASGVIFCLVVIPIFNVFGNLALNPPTPKDGPLDTPHSGDGKSS